MGSDLEREREAAEWCQALIGDSFEADKESFDTLDNFNSDPHPAKCQAVNPESDVFE